MQKEFVFVGTQTQPEGMLTVTQQDDGSTITIIYVFSTAGNMWSKAVVFNRFDRRAQFGSRFHVYIEKERAVLVVPVADGQTADLIYLNPL